MSKGVLERPACPQSIASKASERFYALIDEGVMQKWYKSLRENHNNKRGAFRAIENPYVKLTFFGVTFRNAIISLGKVTFLSSRGDVPRLDPPSIIFNRNNIIQQSFGQLRQTGLHPIPGITTRRCHTPSSGSTHHRSPPTTLLWLTLHPGVTDDGDEYTIQNTQYMRRSITSVFIGAIFGNLYLLYLSLIHISEPTRPL